jgi:hypothetical protein
MTASATPENYTTLTDVTGPEFALTEPVSAEANGLRGLFCWDDWPWPTNVEMSLRRRILGSRPRGCDQHAEQSLLARQGARPGEIANRCDCNQEATRRS